MRQARQSRFRLQTRALLQPAELKVVFKELCKTCTRLRCNTQPRAAQTTSRSEKGFKPEACLQKDSK